jgi:hypothetical protein
LNDKKNNKRLNCIFFIFNTLVYKQRASGLGSPILADSRFFIQKES